MRSCCSDVWNSVCSMWKPVLSAANQVRCTFMPPKKRTLMRPSSCRLQGQPQCSSCTISCVQFATKKSTASWSHSQSPPETVSSKCLSSESSGRITPAEPPSAATVWLRIGTTLLTRATCSPASDCTAAMAARRPAPPPPTTTTSHAITCIGTSSGDGRRCSGEPCRQAGPWLTCVKRRRGWQPRPGGRHIRATPLIWANSASPG